MNKEIIQESITYGCPFNCGWLCEQCDQAFTSISIGLCQGRHEIPQVENYIYDEIVDVTDVAAIENTATLFVESVNHVDYIDIYVTGLTIALVAVLKALTETKHHSIVTLYHYNNVTKEYFKQVFKS